MLTDLKWNYPLAEMRKYSEQQLQTKQPSLTSPDCPLREPHLILSSYLVIKSRRQHVIQPRSLSGQPHRMMSSNHHHHHHHSLVRSSLLIFLVFACLPSSHVGSWPQGLLTIWLLTNLSTSPPVLPARYRYILPPSWGMLCVGRQMPSRTFRNILRLTGHSNRTA